MSVPRAAPSVFQPYKRLTPASKSRRREETKRASAGNVPPMSIVGIRMTTAANPNRTQVKVDGPRCSQWYNAT